MGRPKRQRRGCDDEQGLPVADVPVAPVLRTPRQQLEAFWRTVLSNQNEAHPDPLAGVISVRAWSQSGHGPGKHWSWLPGRTKPPMHLRGDGHSTAHPGSVTAPEVGPEERLLRALDLSPQQFMVMRLRYSPVDGTLSDLEVATRAGLTLSQVQRAVEEVRRKQSEHAELVARLGARFLLERRERERQRREPKEGTVGGASGDAPAEGNYPSGEPESGDVSTPGRR